MGGFHVGRGFASKAVWLVGGGSDCRHGTRAGRVRASRGTDCRHGASGITTARTAHGSANAAPRSSCLAGRPARRSSRRDVITFHLRGRLSGRPRHETSRPCPPGRDGRLPLKKKRYRLHNPKSLAISLPYEPSCMHDPSEDERRYERGVQLVWVVAILTSVLIVLLALRGCLTERARRLLYLAAHLSVDTVHPRACGGHQEIIATFRTSGGSSPRMRGHGVNHGPGCAHCGFIPAHAGDTCIAACAGAA